MRSFFSGLMVGIALMLFPYSGIAADLYYIELGKVDSESEASEQWQSLLDSHTALLEDLSFFPRTVIHSGGKKKVHIYAGTIEEKKDAQRICNHLFEKEVSCFIVEGLPLERIKTKKNIVQEETLPWLSEPVKTDTHQVEPVEDSGIFSWVFGSGDDKKQEDAPVATKMEVAEAIRVPLTENTEPDVMRISEPVISNKLDKKAVGWLAIRSFQSQSEATSFWEMARMESPEMAAGLRVLVLRSKSIELSVGPFGSEEDAMAFCSKAVQSLDSELTCLFTRREPRQTAKTSMSSDRSERYNQRREIAVNHEESSSTVNGKRLYWLEIASASTHEEAINIWKKFSKNNRAVLAGTKNSIIPSDETGGYLVRVGPFATNDEATDICYSLRQSGAECQISGGL